MLENESIKWENLIYETSDVANFNIILMNSLAELCKPNFLESRIYYPGTTFWIIPNGKDKTARQTRCRTKTKDIKAVWVQEIESGCLLQNCVVVMLLIPNHQHCITNTAPVMPNFLSVLTNVVTTKVACIKNIYLRTINTNKWK